MTTTWYTSNLPNDQSDLHKLIQWFHEHDPDWMADALWLRYLKIGKQVYQLDESYQACKRRVAESDEFQRSRRETPIPPFALDVLPPSDGIDRLSALPHDIRIEVLSHLRLLETRIDVRGNKITARHPLSSLALVSKGWRDQVEACCSHFLLVWKHEAEAQHKSGEASNWIEWRELATYTASARMEYVFRTRKHCGVCGQPLRQLSLSKRWPWLLSCDDCELNDCREHGRSDSAEQDGD